MSHFAEALQVWIRMGTTLEYHVCLDIHEENHETNTVQ